MLQPSGNPFKCHEVLYLQPIVPPKRFDIFFPACLNNSRALEFGACWVRSERGDREMVVDGGGHFSPAGIDGVHTLTLLFSSLTAHQRAEGNPI